MDEFKDLSLLISEAKRMSNAFRAFDRIPRVLESLQSLKATVETLNETAGKKNEEINIFDKKIDTANAKLKSINADIKEKGDEFNALDQTVKNEKSILVSAMMLEVKKFKVDCDDEIEKKRASTEDILAKNDKIIEDSHNKLISVRSENSTKIKELEKVTAEYEKKAATALESLEKIKKSLSGDG